MKRRTTIIGLFCGCLFVCSSHADMSIYDNFDDGVIDSRYWTVTVVGEAAVIEDNGHMSLLSNTENDTCKAELNGLPHIFGDFEALFFYELIHHADVPNARFGMSITSMQDPDFYLQFYHHRWGPNGVELIASWGDSLGGHGNLGWIYELLPAGWMKIDRTGNRFGCYYGSESDWELLCTLDHPVDDLFVNIWSHPNEQYPPFEYHFDEFHLNADSLAFYLPVSDNPHGGDTGPKRVMLNSISPCPFSISTRIHYSTKASGHVQLDIFDIAGRHVDTVVDETQGPGDYTISWSPPNTHNGSFIGIVSLGNHSDRHRLISVR